MSPSNIEGIEGAAQVYGRLAEAVKDVCWKATPYGTTGDGDVAAYLIPKGAIHRLVGAAQGAGISASLRVQESGQATDARQGSAEPDDGIDECVRCGVEFWGEHDCHTPPATSPQGTTPEGGSAK